MHGYEATREAANGGVCEELGDGEARSGGGLGSRPVALKRLNQAMAALSV
jgi:hypothetical protein